MLTVGLTGGIGSGKSTIAKIFETLGIPVFNSDIEAKKLLSSNKAVIQLVHTEFPSVFESNQLNKKKLAQLVFSNPAALGRLNLIIHPTVKKVFQQWVIRNNTAPFVIKEAAILVESGLFKTLDILILVKAPKQLRIKRVMARDGASEKEVQQRINNQFSDDDKIPFSNFIITNDEETLVVPQVLAIFKQITNRA